MKNFADLTEREVLAVAIAAEEEDSRIYMSFAEDLTGRYPESAKIFEEMAEEEKGHRHMLLEMYQQRFGSNLPPIRRDNVKGFLRRPAICATRSRRTDGRIGVDAGAAVRRRLCNASQLADLPGGTGRLDRCRHQHGVCGSPVR